MKWASQLRSRNFESWPMLVYLIFDGKFTIFWWLNELFLMVKTQFCWLLKPKFLMVKTHSFWRLKRQIQWWNSQLLIGKFNILMLNSPKAWSWNPTFWWQNFQVWSNFHGVSAQRIDGEAAILEALASLHGESSQARRRRVPGPLKICLVIYHN